MDKPIDSNLNACPSSTILEGIDPIPVGLGHLDLQNPTVSHGILVVNRASPALQPSVVIEPLESLTKALAGRRSVLFLPDCGQS